MNGNGLKYSVWLGSGLLVIGLAAALGLRLLAGGQAKPQAVLPQTNQTVQAGQPRQNGNSRAQAASHLSPKQPAETTEAGKVDLKAVADFSVWAAAWLGADPQVRTQADLLAEGERLALSRRAVLKELIQTDPRQAVALAAPAGFQRALPASITRHLEERVSGQGSLMVMILDNFEEGTSEVQREARIGNKTYRAYVFGRGLKPKSQLNVLIQGIAVDSALAVEEGPIVAGDSGGIYGGGGVLTQSRWTQGAKSLLLMRVAFPDDPSEPITDPGARAMMDQVNQFYVQNSYDSVAIIADVTPLLIMPQNKSAYGLLGTTGLQTDARQAALAAGFDDDVYDRDIVLFNSIPGASFAGWNGLANIGAKGVWMQGTTSAGVAAHELGHNFGLYHANFWSAVGDSIIGPGSTVEYGNPFDIMGNANVGIYQFNAQCKNQMDWLPAFFVQSVTNSGTFRLYAFDVPQIVSGRKYALRVNKDSARNYWAEFRQEFTSNPWLQNGVLLNWDPWDNHAANSLGGTDLLDTTPGTPTANSGKDDAAVVMGRTFADPGAGIYITPLAKGSDGSNNWIDVQINLGDFTNNLAPTLQISVDQTNVALNVPVDFVAAASDPNGDSLAYYWDFGDLSFGSNSPNASKSWSAAGQYVVRCTASDMKGGEASRYVVVTVGAPGTYQAAGRITSNDQPLEGVRVNNGLSGSSYRGAYTDSDGYYTLANLAAGSSTLSAVKYSYNLGPSGWANPLTLGPNASGVDWIAAANPVVSVSAPDPLAAEPNPAPDTATLTLTRTGSLTSPLTVKFNLNGTAIYGTDYQVTPAPSGSGYPYQITLPAGVSSTNLVVVPLSDSAIEGNESLFMTLVEDSAYAFGTFAEAAVSIAGKVPALPVVNVYADKDLAPQSGSDSGWFRFTRDGIATNDLTVFYAVSGTATNGVDYMPLSGALTIPAGNTEALVPLTAINQDDAEGDKMVVITVASNATYVVGSNASALATIFNDYFTTVTIAASDSLAWEGTGNTGTFTVTRVGSLSANLLVNYSLGGTASNGVDYVSLPGSVLIPAGMGTASFTVSPINNSVLNGKRTVIATLLSNPGYNVGNPGVAQVNLLDDEMPAISLVASKPNASEAGPVTGQFTFTRTGSITNPLTVYFDIYGTAINGADYAAITNSIIIPAGTNSAVLTIAPVQDLIREATESVVIVLRDDPAYNLSTTTPQTVTIADNNTSGLPGVGFDWAAASGPESQEYVPVVVSLSAASTATVTVNYAATGGTANSNNWTDYYLPSGHLTFAPGQTKKSFTLYVLEDALVEPNETIVISLSNPVNALLDANSNYVYTIIDNDASGIVTITGINTNASEAGPVSGTVRISRSGGTNTDLPVFFQVTGSASSPSDYVPIGNSAIIPAGQSNVDIVITPIENSTPEPTETVTVTLTGVTGATIGTPNSATVWIAETETTDNSPIVSIVASDPVASQAGPDVGTFTIARDRNTNVALTVNFTLGGTAASGVDYFAISNSVAIPEGASEATITVTPRGTVIAPSNQTVVATLTIAGAYRAFPALTSATVTILGAVPPVIAVQPQSQTVGCGSNATFSVVATGNPPPAYQWLFNGSNSLSGATSANLTLTNVPVTSAGGYSCLVTNDYGSVTSSIATLTVTREPLRFDTSPLALQMTDGGFRLRLLGLAGAGPVEIYASSDLVTWATVFTNPPLVGTLEFIDPMATNDAQRYYRAAEIRSP